jgi:hypothetical protein
MLLQLEKMTVTFILVIFSFVNDLSANPCHIDHHSCMWTHLACRQ